MSGFQGLRIDRRAFLLGTSAVGALTVMHPFSVFAAANQAHLRMMETTDIHVDVLPYDYYADAPNDTMGLSRTAALIDVIRAEATNSMLIDNGDYLQGNPMGDYIAYERGMKDGDLHPIIEAMNTLGYECCDARQSRVQLRPRLPGQGERRRQLPAGVRQPRARHDTRLQPARRQTLPQALRHRREAPSKTATEAEYPIKIGFIGFVPPQIMVWDPSNLVGNVMTRDIVEAAKAWVPQMKEAGADIIIALSHSGIDAKRQDGMENAVAVLRRSRPASTRSSPATSTSSSRAPQYDDLRRRRQRQRAR